MDTSYPFEAVLPVTATLLTKKVAAEMATGVDFSMDDAREDPGVEGGIAESRQEQIGPRTPALSSKPFRSNCEDQAGPEGREPVGDADFGDARQENGRRDAKG